MVLPMYLDHYKQGKDFTASTYGHICAKDAITQFCINTIITKHVKIIPLCSVGGGIDNCIYQMILQSKFMTKKYEAKFCSIFVINN